MRVADLNGFVDHMNNTKIDKMRGVGASDVQGQRIILGGEAAGTVNVTGNGTVLMPSPQRLKNSKLIQAMGTSCRTSA